MSDEQNQANSQDYIPAQITQEDKTLATHCETFLCTECSMSHEHKMKRIAQSIADYREFWVKVERQKLWDKIDKLEAYIRKLDGILEEVGGVTVSCINPYEDIKRSLMHLKLKAGII